MLLNDASEEIVHMENKRLKMLKKRICVALC
jgi:hypothetical protein